ncbi:MAG: SEC-C metal-binding domain-containing protein [Planctomycetota bacterium]|nr:SEC-C metal-binding domain-containing protein [Planctomycetota bacterium]
MHDHGPVPDHIVEKIDLWVSDFMERPAAAEPAGRVGADAPAVLVAFLQSACHGHDDPADVEGHAVSHALFDHVAPLALPAGAHDGVPSLVAAFLADLQEVGRMADGRLLAAQVRASASAYRDRAAGRTPQERRVAPKVGRNDPCPCGSGQKYKRCCLTALDG